MAAKKSVRKFRTEVSELLDLIIHSLYSHKEIFLRELISNASDAIDRLKYKANTDPSLTQGDTEFSIELIPDHAARTLEIVDNGIGMTFDEVVENIGTIAKSGTAEFAAALKASRDACGLAPDLIGQFGVGFYSAFMVADKITLTTRAAGAETGVRWESAGDGSYTVEEVDKPERGTRILLTLRPREEGDEDYADEWVLRRVVKRHSDFVSYPITMKATRRVPALGPDGKPLEATFEERVETDVLNSMKALWARPKAEVTEEEHEEFYKHIAHDWVKPLSRLHAKLEGATEFDALLYIPERRPVDLFTPERKHGIQLYCRRVFIMDDCRELVPDYLRFLRGVVDSADLSLNVSREILQEDRTIRAIRKTLVRKVLDHIAELDAEAFATFTKEFGVVLKEGVHTDPDNRDRIAKLLRYATTASEGKPVSLDDYVARMKEGQEHIYYLTGDSPASLAENPHLERLRSLGFEALLMTDPVDEFVVAALPEYAGKKLKSAEKGDLGLAPTPEETEREKESAEFLTFLKSALADKANDVKASHRLTESAACLSGDEDDMSALMAKMMRASGHGGFDLKRVLEVNLAHPLVGALQRLHAANPADPQLPDQARLLYDLALLAEGGRLEHPAVFSQRIGELAAKALEK